MAVDGDGRNGIFTKNLLVHLETPGVEVGQMLRMIRVSVEDETKGKQVPWESSSLKGNFYFVSGSKTIDEKGLIEERKKVAEERKKLAEERKKLAEEKEGIRKEKEQMKTANLTQDTSKGLATITGEIGLIKTNLGTIKIKFFPKAAPGHVKNFKKLAKSGFYNGTTFHRVIPRFMIQGGDPNTKDNNRSNHGTGGPGYQIKAEFNNISHKRGIVSMARSRNPDSAGSQFFICVADSTFLDGQYTVFGEVIEGMDIADKIVSVKRDRKDNPTEKVTMTKVSIEKK